MRNESCHRGSGNVYKDLGFPDSEEMQAKAAEALGIPQPKISSLSRGKFSGFSIGKLINLLNKLNQDIEIVIKNKPTSSRHFGHVCVTYA